MHEPSLAGLAGLFLKNHLELRTRLAQSPSLLDVPFSLSLDFPFSRSTPSMMRMALDKGALVLTFQEGPRTLVLTSSMEGLSNPAGECVVQVSDQTGKQTIKVRASELANLAVPPAFKQLHERVLSHLQSLCPDLFPKRPVKPETTSAAEAVSPTQAPGAPKEASEDATSPSQKDESPAATSEYQWYVVQCQNAPDVRFKGKLLIERYGRVSQGRGRCLRVYETEGKKLVALKMGVSQWLGERTTVETMVASTPQELVAFFGYAPEAKALYRDMNINAETVVE